MNEQQKTILIIEDSLDLADSLEDLLKFEKYKTIKTVTGKEGFALALEKKPDLIILDLRLPDIDGMEILRRLRKDAWGQTAKVLILTASDFEVDSVPEMNIAPEDVVHKIDCSIKNIADAVSRKLNE